MRFTRWNWNLEMLVFVEGGKPENPEKNPRSKNENQQQTQPTYDTGTGNQTQATLVEGECSHHCAIPAPSLGTWSYLSCVFTLAVEHYKAGLCSLIFHKSLQINLGK